MGRGGCARSAQRRECSVGESKQPSFHVDESNKQGVPEQKRRAKREGVRWQEACAGSTACAVEQPAPLATPSPAKHIPLSERRTCLHSEPSTLPVAGGQDPLRNEAVETGETERVLVVSQGDEAL